MNGDKIQFVPEHQGSPPLLGKPAFEEGIFNQTAQDVINKGKLVASVMPVKDLNALQGIQELKNMPNINTQHDIVGMKTNQGISSSTPNH